ncbi:hypothetical protein LSH36_214g05051 [Paralvinella palmiformis]|uniref:ENTH domain-containing protein n=1 Tax=Paralvinella palmiformis TaxID=53620 RepID=A0AAD9JNQ3_9ANNE|nr:hypothetical protein LSH36_214g05051 [Paralvinella palmiformis]
MASAHMPRGLNPRGVGRMDSERENFEKTQTTALQKALTNLEAPLKEKHCRRAILGTHQEHGCTVFWSIVLRYPLQGNPIVCWKFCHVLHKILRDGHENCSKDSYRYTGFLTDLGKLWGHLKIGLSRLIAFYTKLLVGRLNFHRKYPSIQGNMVLDDGDLEKICNNDINSYFEMCVDMLDYLDDILGLQASVFDSLDMSRANSMTLVGQCRLAPLIPCILDSCQVYDSTVKLLFKLHSNYIYSVIALT